MQIEDGVKKIFFEIFQNLSEDKFSLGTLRREFENWDSLAHMQLVSEMENVFGVRFEIGEIVDVETPQGFVDLLKKKKNIQ
ncbi:acyl carrier protein [Candidatus Uhrbacteria bacterium]|nr:acyl carrier protein [Candidatus Uhrbacteria bacterium]